MAPAKSKGKEARSRNGTPLSVEIPDSSDGGPTSSPMPPTNMSYGDLLEHHCRGASPPASVTLKRILEALKICSDVANERCENHDRGMRETLKRRKELLEFVREQEIEEKRAEEEKQEELRQAALNKQKEDSRPPAIGAHSLAPQDGNQPNGTTDAVINESENVGEAPTQPPAPAEVQQPRPVPPVPLLQTFGEDPTTFDDPTIYQIRQVRDDMTDEEKKEILNVAEYPHSDLHDLTPGTPPDRDFSSYKSEHRVTAVQFGSYLEPWVRPLTQEDLTFLEERGDRTGPFAMTKRGPRHYQDIWDEEDGITHENGVPLTPKPSTNRPSGSMEQMNDEVAERGDVSVGPMMSRLLSTLIPERRGPAADQGNGNVNGDAFVNGTTNGDNGASAERQSETQSNANLPPATYFPESGQPGWKNQPPKMDYAQADERLKQELRYIGFLSEDAEPDYDGHHDDEVAARLRFLQEELQRVSVLNGARKARIAEVAEERIASQEWGLISDDLDNQLNQGYSKRHRNMGRSKKPPPKRPGGSSGGAHPSGSGIGVSKPGLGEPMRALMERRKEWHRLLGPLVDHGRAPVPSETIFDEANMERLKAIEKERWTEAQEQP